MFQAKKNKKIRKFIILLKKSNSIFVLFCLYFFFLFLFGRKNILKKKGTIGIGLDLDQAYSTTKKE